MNCDATQHERACDVDVGNMVDNSSTVLSYHGGYWRPADYADIRAGVLLQATKGDMLWRHMWSGITVSILAQVFNQCVTFGTKSSIFSAYGLMTLKTMGEGAVRSGQKEVMKTVATFKSQSRGGAERS